jgi:glycosyltransferase involved in cell wall biosynthesis
MTADPIDATILIATYNRAALLEETLASIARMKVSAALRWETIVVDNNSTDGTRVAVERHVPTFPAPLRYLFEARQGRSSALNAGIAEAEGTVLVFTDDDVRVADGWLDAAVLPLLAAEGSVVYTGGPVHPLWGAAPPPWLEVERGDLWGTIAIQNHGRDAFVYEERRKVPLGANMAMRREVFERIGGFRPDLGRAAGPLVLGQEVPELLMRVRAAGLQGLYVPAMAVDHHVPAHRLTRQYFRRWWFGKGLSRAAMDRVQPVTDLGVDLRTTPHVLGVPRFMYGTMVRDLFAFARERLRDRPGASFRHQMMVVYVAGYIWASWRSRRGAPMPAEPHPLVPARRGSKVVATDR